MNENTVYRALAETKIQSQSLPPSESGLKIIIYSTVFVIFGMLGFVSCIPLGIPIYTACLFGGGCGALACGIAKLVSPKQKSEDRRSEEPESASLEGKSEDSGWEEPESAALEDKKEYQDAYESSNSNSQNSEQNDDFSFNDGNDQTEELCKQELQNYYITTRAKKHNLLNILNGSVSWLSGGQEQENNDTNNDYVQILKDQSVQELLEMYIGNFYQQLEQKKSALISDYFDNERYTEKKQVLTKDDFTLCFNSYMEIKKIEHVLTKLEIPNQKEDFKYPEAEKLIIIDLIKRLIKSYNSTVFKDNDLHTSIYDIINRLSCIDKNLISAISTITECKKLNNYQIEIDQYKQRDSMGFSQYQYFKNFLAVRNINTIDLSHIKQILYLAGLEEFYCPDNTDIIYNIHNSRYCSLDKNILNRLLDKCSDLDNYKNHQDKCLQFMYYIFKIKQEDYHSSYTVLLDSLRVHALDSGYIEFDDTLKQIIKSELVSSWSNDRFKFNKKLNADHFISYVHILKSYLIELNNVYKDVQDDKKSSTTATAIFIRFTDNQVYHQYVKKSENIVFQILNCGLKLGFQYNYLCKVIEETEYKITNELEQESYLHLLDATDYYCRQLIIDGALVNKQFFIKPDKDRYP